MVRISVAEAAKVLGVRPQRIHERIHAGSLPAERVGHQWTIEEADLATLRHRDTPGRPLSRKSAWALIAVGANDARALARLLPSDRSRARSRLRALVDRVQSADLNQAAALLGTTLGNRAVRATYAASGRDLPDIREDARIRLSGLSADGSNVSAGHVIEGYVSAHDIDSVVSDYLLSPASPTNANVVLHVLNADVDAFVSDDALLSPLLRAADLAEHPGVRERNEAVNAVAEVEQRTFVRRGNDRAQDE